MLRHWVLYNRIALAIAGGLISNLMINVQPQTGKSRYWSEFFPAWMIGIRPETRVVLSSYEAGYAASWGRKTRDILEAVGPGIFGVNVRQDSHAADEWELQGHEGGMVTSGMGGPLTGRPADLAIVDDPIKNSEEGASKTHKDKQWDWWDSTLSTRIHEGGIRIVLMTRWAEDDLCGRILKRAKETGEKWTTIRLPAIAEEDESFPDFGWSRKKGEVLCPQLYSAETMASREKNTLPFWWATTYQQRPYPREGGELKSSWFEIVDADKIPRLDIACRSWDLAATKDKSGAQTAGARMGRVGAGEDRKYFITDFHANWWEAGDRDKEIKQTAKADGQSLHVILEQEPGSGGKTQAQAIARKLDGWPVTIVVASNEGSKQLRADPLAAAAHGGRVFLKRAPWNEAFLEQVRSFPGGNLIDMVDAAAQGFNWLSAQPDPVEIPDTYDPMDFQKSAPPIFPGGGEGLFP